MVNVQQSLIGLVFGRLTITKVLPKPVYTLQKVVAICECGVEKEYWLSNLKRNNHTTSCGCARKDMYDDSPNKTHDLSKHPLYRVWGAIKRRCLNTRSSDYYRYGGRGVKICDEWINSFKCFYDWAITNGWQKGLQIDKDIKGDGLLYSPSTCSIVTGKKNQNHRRDCIVVLYKGNRFTLAELAERYNVKYGLLWRRFSIYRWDIEKCIHEPVRKIG